MGSFNFVVTVIQNCGGFVMHWYIALTVSWQSYGDKITQSPPCDQWIWIVAFTIPQCFSHCLVSNFHIVTSCLFSYQNIYQAFVDRRHLFDSVSYHPENYCSAGPVFFYNWLLFEHSFVIHSHFQDTLNLIFVFSFVDWR